MYDVSVYTCAVNTPSMSDVIVDDITRVGVKRTKQSSVNHFEY